MEKEQESKGMEEKRTADRRLGYRIVVGAGLGYVVGRGLLKKPILGVALGVVLALILGSGDEEE